MHTAIKSLLSLALLAALAACGGPEERSALAAHDQPATGEALTADSVDGQRPGVLPPVVSFRKLKHHNLVPSFKVASHFVNSIAASPDDPTHFRAYGMDARTRVIYYHIDGDTERDLADLLTIVDKQIVHNGLQAQGAGLEYSWGGAGQIIIKAPPDPNPPIPGGLPQAAVSKLLGLAEGIHTALVISLQAVAR